MMLKVYLRNDAISQMNNSGIFGSPGTSNSSLVIIAMSPFKCPATRVPDLIGVQVRLIELRSLMS